MRLRNFVVAIALVTACFVVVAGVARAAGESPGQRTFVTLHVNTVDQGETVVVLRAPDIFIPVSVLAAAGVHDFKGERVTLMGKEYVSLSSLEPDVKFAFDIDALKLDITVAPQRLASVAKDLAPARPANITYASSRTAYLNYALSDATGGMASAFFDGAFSHAEDSLHYSFTAQRNQPLRRGLIYYQADDRVTTQRRIIGDLSAESGDLGAAVYMAGFAIGRDFNLDPYVVHFPLPSLSGAAATPSTAAIYVNGVLVQRVDLPPGSFDLNHLPVTTGSANTQVIVTDAFGRSQVYSQNFYTSANLLSRGLTDYQFAVGLLRNDAFGNGDSYGPAAAIARYSIGVNDALTVGGRFEATPRVISAGPAIDFRLPVGYVHVAASASRAQGLGGAALSFGYGYSSPRFAFNLSALSEGPYYASAGLSPWQDRPTSAISASMSWQMTRGRSLSLQYFRRHMRDSGTGDTISLSNAIPLNRGAALILGIERDRNSLGASSVAITSTINFALGKATTASATARSGSLQDSSVDVERSPAGKYGLGYSATYDPSLQHAFNGTVTYRAPFGDAELDVANLHGSPTSGAVRFAGGLVDAGGGVFATRPILSSFALVDVPNVRGVPVYLENQYVGKTNGAGKLLVPDLLPNFGNQVRIDDKDLPVDMSVQSLQKTIAPPDQGGAVVTFTSEAVRALRGTLLVKLAGATVIPKYGELTLMQGANTVADSALGVNGEFYFENVPQGRYRAVALFAQGRCEFEFRAPETAQPLTDLHALVCVKP